MNRLKGKRALITGGTSGIGLATAREFLAEGARVAVTGTNPATIEAARADLGPEVMVIRADAGDAAGQQAVAQADPCRALRPPGAIAQAVVFVASDEAAFTVGSELVADGGMSNL